MIKTLDDFIIELRKNKKIRMDHYSFEKDLRVLVRH